MVRTNIVIDDDLVDRVRQRYALGSKREAVDFALRALLAADEAITPQQAALALRGTWADRSDDELRAIYGDDWWRD